MLSLEIDTENKKFNKQIDTVINIAVEGPLKAQKKSSTSIGSPSCKNQALKDSVTDEGCYCDEGLQVQGSMLLAPSYR